MKRLLFVLLGILAFAAEASAAPITLGASVQMSGPLANTGRYYRDGYQSPPIDWGINTDRKRAFFARVREIAGE